MRAAACIGKAIEPVTQDDTVRAQGTGQCGAVSGRPCTLLCSTAWHAHDRRHAAQGGRAASVFAPFTGAQLSRAPRTPATCSTSAPAMPTRPRSWCSTCSTIGIQRIGIVYQNNSFGKEVFNAASSRWTGSWPPRGRHGDRGEQCLDAGTAAAAGSRQPGGHRDWPRGQAHAGVCEGVPRAQAGRDAVCAVGHGHPGHRQGPWAQTPRAWRSQVVPLPPTW